MSSPRNPHKGHLSRRGFITSVGAGAAGAVALGSEALADPTLDAGPWTGSTTQEAVTAATPADRFGRIFPDLFKPI